MSRPKDIPKRPVPRHDKARRAAGSKVVADKVRTIENGDFSTWLEIVMEELDLATATAVSEALHGEIPPERIERWLQPQSFEFPMTGEIDALIRLMPQPISDQPGRTIREDNEFADRYFKKRNLLQVLSQAYSKCGYSLKVEERCFTAIRSGHPIRVGLIGSENCSHTSLAKKVVSELVHAMGLEAEVLVIPANTIIRHTLVNKVDVLLPLMELKKLPPPARIELLSLPKVRLADGASLAFYFPMEEQKLREIVHQAWNTVASRPDIREAISVLGSGRQR